MIMEYRYFINMIIWYMYVLITNDFTSYRRTVIMRNNRMIENDILNVHNYYLKWWHYKKAFYALALYLYLRNFMIFQPYWCTENINLSKKRVLFDKL